MFNLYYFSYTMLSLIFVPIMLTRAFIRGRTYLPHKLRWQERFGFYKDNKLKESIWLHAVSLGESKAATTLINKLIENYKHINIVVTTTTATGSQYISNTFKQRIKHYYIPYDTPYAVKCFLKHINPKIALIMETEIWPTIFCNCFNKKIPVIMINARISPKSLKHYNMLKPLIQPILNKVSLIGAQSSIDQRRFAQLTTNNLSNIKLIGNIKFAINNNNFNLSTFENYKNLFTNRFIIIAASTHNPEETELLNEFKKIKTQIPNSILLIAPRHPDRFLEVEKIIASHNLNYIKHSTIKHDINNSLIADNIDVYLIDALGELDKFYYLSDICFVGGSLAPIGGHNLLEPANFAKPIITGSHLENCQEIAASMLEKNALIKIAQATEFYNHVISLFNNPEKAATMAKNSLAFVKSNNKILDDYYSAITKYL